ncbi:anti-sigma factor antagonist [Azospirillum thermophilum]|uniref:Anti-sigma factor antagonist n=2 Tax=Azospirillum thermophilum TaxID=2202148 RepID=A0A2S2CPP5_9PROT|nr:anti-sigma factor antagonist [Azospirillum thermophilum]
MDYSVHDAQDSTEIRLKGRMTYSDHDTFRSVIAAFERPPGHRIVFDLSGLDFVDSSGLGMFIIAKDTAEKRNLQFTLRGARDEVQRLITIAKFHKVFSIDD